MHLEIVQMLVKPAGKVLNYRTEVTGATDATMQVRYCCISALHSCFAAGKPAHIDLGLKQIYCEQMGMQGTVRLQCCIADCGNA